MSHGSASLWINRLNSGDDQAAQFVWERYYSRLIALARSKLRGVAHWVADEEDVVQNAFNSFFQGVQEVRFPRLADRDDLWQILLVITVRKAINQRKHFGAAKRGGGKVRGESARSPNDSDEAREIEQVLGDEPTPEIAVLVAECFQQIFDELGDTTLRLIALLKFEWYSNPEISKSMGCSLSSIERKLSLIRRRLSEFTA